MIRSKCAANIIARFSKSNSAALQEVPHFHIWPESTPSGTEKNKNTLPRRTQRPQRQSFLRALGVLRSAIFLCNTVTHFLKTLT